VEHDLIPAARRDDLPVAPAQRSLGPPPILYQPGFAHAVDDAIVDQERLTVVGGTDRDALGDR
jgi:hypothetical protein